MSLFTGENKGGALRTVRLLRPLRSINKVKGIRVIVTSLLESLESLAHVSLFLLFIIILFGTFGLHLFYGMYEHRCRMTEFPVNGTWDLYPNYTRLCSVSLDNCPAGSYCGAPNAYGLYWKEKVKDEINVYDFNYGITGFDNIW